MVRRMRRAPVPSTVIFDLCEVFVSGIIGVERELHRLYPQYSAAEIDRHLMSADPEGWPRELFIGAISEKEWLARARTRSRVRIPDAVIATELRKNMVRPIPGSESILRQLSGQVDTLVVLSDHAREWVEDIKPQLQFLDLFQHQLWSYELGKVKRDPSLWPQVLRRVDVPARECLFVDDSPGNVARAREHGIRGHRFDRDPARGAAKLAAALRQRGFEING